MEIVVITNQRQFAIPYDDIKLQTRGGKGVNILNIAKKKLQAGEEILSYYLQTSTNVLE